MTSPGAFAPPSEMPEPPLKKDDTNIPGHVAQSVEQGTHNPLDPGSNPGVPRAARTGRRGTVS